MDNEAKLYNDLYEACFAAVEEVGPLIEEVSWFGHWNSTKSEDQSTCHGENLTNEEANQ